MLKKVEDSFQPVGNLLTDPTVLAMMLGGLGAGGVTAYMKSKTRGYKGEDKKARRRRILRNALLAGGAGAAAAGLGSAAYRSLATALPEGDTDPTTAILEPALRVGATGGLATWLHNKGMQHELGARESVLRHLRSQLKGPLKDKYSDVRSQIDSALSGDLRKLDTEFFDLHKRFTRGSFADIPNAFADTETVRRAGGLDSYDPADGRYWVNKDAWKGKGTKMGDLLAGTGPGRTAGRVLKGFGRGPAGAGLAAAGLGAAVFTPEILAGAIKAITGQH